MSTFRKSLIVLLVMFLVPVIALKSGLVPAEPVPPDSAQLDNRLLQLQQAKGASGQGHPGIRSKLYDMAGRLASRAGKLPPGVTPQQYDFSHLSTPAVHVDKNGAIQVYIHVSRWGESERAALSNLGVRIEIIADDLNIVQAWVPYDRLDQVADMEFVTRITLPHYGEKQAGSVLTQGDAILHADDVRALGISGSGARVGVISGGAAGLSAAQQSGDLPSVTVLRTAAGDAEGTAMLEIVHDLAPDAALGFCGMSAGTSLDFLYCVNALRNGFDADVIVDDIVFFSEPYFEDGDVAATVRAAVNSGLFYTSSAGNRADKHYEAAFLDYGGSGFHNFGGRAGSADDIDVDFQIPPGETLSVWLQWNEPFGGSCSDYDLGLFDEFNNLLDFSIDIQDCNDDPLEFVSYTNSYSFIPIPAYLSVIKSSGSNRKLEMFYTLLPEEYAISQGSIIGHAAVGGVMAVGAINASDPGLDTIAPYSSRGPSEIYYPSHQLRNKPDITAIDGVSVTGAGGFMTPFFGTSAAAPHVAGVAALLKSAGPAVTSSRISQAIRNSAIDRGAAGFDRIFGYGLVDALAAVQLIIDTDGDHVPDQDDNCPNVANPDQADFDGDGAGNACDKDDDNDGMPDAYESANGFDPLNPADASADADGDGYDNLAEYQAGTDPHDPASAPGLRFLPWLPLLLD